MSASITTITVLLITGGITAGYVSDVTGASATTCVVSLILAVPLVSLAELTL